MGARPERRSSVTVRTLICLVVASIPIATASATQSPETSVEVDSCGMDVELAVARLDANTYALTQDTFEVVSSTEYLAACGLTDAVAIENRTLPDAVGGGEMPLVTFTAAPADSILDLLGIEVGTSVVSAGVPILTLADALRARERLEANGDVTVILLLPDGASRALRLEIVVPGAPEPEHGTLVVMSRPSGRVVINGVMTEHETPIRDLQVPPGAYEVRVCFPDGALSPAHVADVAAGERATTMWRAAAAEPGGCDPDAAAESRVP